MNLEEIKEKLNTGKYSPHDLLGNVTGLGSLSRWSGGLVLTLVNRIEELEAARVVSVEEIENAIADALSWEPENDQQAQELRSAGIAVHALQLPKTAAAKDAEYLLVKECLEAFVRDAKNSDESGWVKVPAQVYHVSKIAVGTLHHLEGVGSD